MSANPAVLSPRNWWTVTGCIIAALAVVTGAFGAHGLPGYLQSVYGSEMRMVRGEEIAAWKKALGDFQTAAEYQMYHGIALVLLGVATHVRCTRSRAIAGWCFLVGTLLFSGSLYVLVLTGQRWLGAITPLGGFLFISGWLSLASTVWPGGECARNIDVVELNRESRTTAR